jgi:hypothetical protein
VNIGSDFCIDSKVLKLAFDGGRVDPYHIMERRGRYRGSLWIGITGLRWMLDIFTKLRNPNQKLEGFFEFHRDGYRVLEFRCLANRGGRFVEITEYHSGAHRGCIRIPKGRKGAGWSVFEFQVRKSFLGDTQKLTAAQTNSSRVSGEGVVAEQAGSSRKDERRRFWKTHKTRSTKSAPDLQPTVLTLKAKDGKSKMAPTEPRPTRSFHFEWKPRSRTIRISLDPSSRRQVSWMGLRDGIGLQAQKSDSGLKSIGPCSLLKTKTQPIVDVGLARLETLNEMDCKTHNPMGLKEKIGEVFGRKNLGCETRVEGGESDLDTEIGRMDSPIAGAQSQGVNLPSEPPAATQTGEPILEDLEDGEIDGEEIGVDHDTGVPSVEVPIPITPMVEAFEEPGCAEVVMPEPSFVTDLVLVRVDLAADLPDTDHEEPDSQLSVMEHHSQTVRSQCEAEPTAPLTCEPLAVVAPPKVSVAPRKPHSLDRSTWVNTQYKGICELMGFPLESHEQQCLALLRRIEAARFIKKGEVGSRKMVVSGTKGARELRNLVSSVNYEGRQCVSC